MNLSTLLVLCVLILIISFSVRTIIKDKKSGKSSCGGDCGACGSHSLCHDSKSLFEEYRKQEEKVTLSDLEENSKKVSAQERQDEPGKISNTIQSDKEINEKNEETR